MWELNWIEMSQRAAFATFLLAAGGAFTASGQTVAVLPFANRTPPASASSGVPNVAPGAAPKADAPAGQDQSPPPAAISRLDWIGESIAETLRDSMGARGVLTMGREETDAAYRRLNLHPRALLTAASAMKTGEALDAEHVVYGSFEWKANAGGGARAGSLTISARTYDRRRMREGPEFVETGSLDDLATLEAHLIWRALASVAPNVAPPESDYRTLRPQVRLDAEENYVRGLIAPPDRKEKFFLQATRLDPRYAHPNYELGQIHYARKGYREAAEWLAKIMPGDPHYRDASFLLGLALFQSGDFAGAQKAFQTVADVVPLSEVWNDLGASQSRRGMPQALDSFRKALEGDASDPVYHFNVGYALWKKGDFMAAAARFRAVLDRQPDDQSATLLLGMCLKRQGPRAGDSRLEALERLKTNYEERAYWQLKAVLAPSHP
jgi:tetratricopeptide (TPR) repeat protein